MPVTMMTRALLVALALTLSLVSGAEAQRPSQAVLAIWGLPTRLVGSFEAVGSYVLMQIQDVLARSDDKGNPVPRLAEKWTRSADGKTYTVTLRPAKFHDGTPVTAEDVKFSYEFYLHPQFPVTAPGLLQIEGAQDVKDGKAREARGIAVVDARTVRFTLTSRYAFFVDQILGANNYIMPKHALAGADVAKILEHPYARRPIGAGPYRLVEWRDRDSMTFEAFAEYWAGKPNLDRLVLRLIAEPATIMAELRAGNIDAGQILPDEFENFQREGRQQVLRMPGDVSFWFSFNHTHPFFKDQRVRQAIYYAVDRDQMVRTLQKGYARVTNSPIHPSLWQYNPALAGYPYDPARARALLSDAGFTPGPGGVLQRDGRPFRVKYTFLSEKRYQDQGLMIQQFLRQVGIELALEPLERGDFFGRYFNVANRDNVEMIGLAWFNLVFPTQGELESNFRSAGATARIFQYASPEIDDLLNQANTAPDVEALRTIYFRVQDVILRDVPRVMTFRPDELWAVQKRLTIPRMNSLVDFFGSIPQWKVQ
jgi:peptide/nickel transport system substrate-binding protein